MNVKNIEGNKIWEGKILQYGELEAMEDELLTAFITKKKVSLVIFGEEVERIDSSVLPTQTATH